jgi:hypothetical protein
MRSLRTALAVHDSATPRGCPMRMPSTDPFAERSGLDAGCRRLEKRDRGQQCWDCPCRGSQFAPDGAVLNGGEGEGLHVAAPPPGSSANAGAEAARHRGRPAFGSGRRSRWIVQRYLLSTARQVPMSGEMSEGGAATTTSEGNALASSSHAASRSQRLREGMRCRPEMRDST